MQNPTANTISFLLFQDFAGQFTYYANFSVPSLPSPLNTANSSQLSSIILGENCNSFLYSSEIYKVSPTGIIKRPSLTNTLQAYSSDFTYIITSNTLFSYSDSSSSYKNLTVLDSYQTYNLVNYAEQLIIWGSSSASTGTTGKYYVNQTVYVLFDQGGAIKTILKHAFSAYNPTSTVPVYVSPLITKIHY